MALLASYCLPGLAVEDHAIAVPLDWRGTSPARLAGVAGIWLAVPAAELAVTLLLLILLRIGYGMRRPIPGGISP